MRLRQRHLPRPVGAVEDPALVPFVRDRLDQLETELPAIARKLVPISHTSAFDIPFRMVAEQIEKDLERLIGAPLDTRRALIQLAKHTIPSQGTWWIRPLLGSPDPSLRRSARAALKRIDSLDVYLQRGGRRDTEALHPKKTVLARHRRGSAARGANGVPDWATVADLRRGLRLQQSQLAYLLVSSDRENGSTRPPYRKAEIAKRHGGTRTLHVPCSHLRGVQRRILRQVLEKVPVHDAAHGFVKGRSVTTHAAQHAGKPLVVCFDLVDFFPTIHFFRVVGLLASFGYDVSEGRFSSHDQHRGVAETLARLCVYAENPASPLGHTPQGAPTSPAIANLVCRSMDSRLAGLARRLGGAYSRYADDLTFSFDSDPEGGLGRFRWWVDAICFQEGFVVHRGKFRVMRASQRQVVTGVVVNHRPRISRRDRRRFRAILHNCRKHGVDSQARGNPRFQDWLRGYAAWIHAVSPDEGREALTAVAELLGEDG